MRGDIHLQKQPSFVWNETVTQAGEFKVDSYIYHIPKYSITVPKEPFKDFITSLVPKGLGTRLRLYECRR